MPLLYLCHFIWTLNTKATLQSGKVLHWYPKFIGWLKNFWYHCRYLIVGSKLFNQLFYRVIYRSLSYPLRSLKNLKTPILQRLYD